MRGSYRHHHLADSHSHLVIFSSKHCTVTMEDVNIEQLKRQRATRRGQITRLQKKVASYFDANLRSLIKADLEQSLKDVHRQLESESSLQDRIEAHLADSPVELEAEQKEAERFDSAMNKLVSDANLALLTYDVNAKCNYLINELELLRIDTAVTSKHHMDNVASFNQEFKELYQSAAPVFSDDRLSAAFTKLKEGKVDLNLSISKALEAVDDSASSTSSATPIVHVPSEPALKIDLPKFNGKPASWLTFQTMFENVISKRGKHLSGVEKTTLLNNAMTTKEAKDLVNQHSSGGVDYDKAMGALKRHFGSIHVIYPILVSTITKGGHFEMTKKSLADLHDKIFRPYYQITSIASDSLSTYLAQYAKQLFSSKLREEWDRHMGAKVSLPTLDDLLEFVEGIQVRLPPDAIDSSDSPSFASSFTVKNEHTAAKKDKKSSPLKCPHCGDRHNLVRCPAFSDLDVETRNSIVRDKKLCLNCLANGHTQKNCPSKYTCRSCKLKHHTMLHRVKQEESQPSENIAASLIEAMPSDDTEFVDTAMVIAKAGPRHATSRILLDSGSGASFVTEALASHLLLKRKPAKHTFSSADSTFVCTQKVNVILSSAHNTNASMDIDCFVVSKIPTTATPGNQHQIISDPVVKDLTLADPDLGGHIDIILGNKGRRQCVLAHTMDHKDLGLGLTKTIFGWTISGPLKKPDKPPMFLVQTQDEELDNALSTLWEMDKVDPAPDLSPDDQQAMDHFARTHRTAPDGRFIITLPKKLDPSTLGDSRPQAIKRFLASEKSLTKKGKMEEFQAVLSEYVTLGHAEQVPRHQLSKNPTYFLPIQGVFKESSTTTKCRAVFDASAKTSTGISLNDTLFTGPNLYPLLADILIKFRHHKFAITADISKMFREVWLDPNDRDLHRFFMRNESGRLEEFRMTRLTFGVRTSPFIATQVLRQLADNHESSYPVAAKNIRENFYVDDLLSGADTVDEVNNIHQQLTTLLQSAGMTLRKWRSNSNEVKSLIPLDLQESDNLQISSPAEYKKALGIHWDSKQDSLHIATPVHCPAKITKKVIASVTAQVFDVLGLFAPAIIPAKILLQSLWKRRIPWDTEVPEDVLDTWNEWLSHLPLITNHSIARRYIQSDCPIVFASLHGFADASSVAYGAVIYLRVVQEDGSTTTSLVTAKAKVLPVKPMTIPRAELTAALLLAKMISHVGKLLSIPVSQQYAWSDSAITLHWIDTPPHRLHTFVANRVTAINQHLHASHWRYVNTKENPADLLSRGILATYLIASTLWWTGPPWLRLPPTEWPPILKVLVKDPPGIKTTCLIISTPPPSFTENYSSFFKLTRVVAWMFRFTKNARPSNADRKRDSLLAGEEVVRARMALYNTAQRQDVEVLKFSPESSLDSYLLNLTHWPSSRQPSTSQAPW